MNNNTQNNDAQKKEFFDLHTTGVGYLNRARTVNPNQGKPYEAVSIAALRGRSDNPSYSYFDTLIVGSDANDFVKKHKDAINDRNTKVLVRFKVGDGEPLSYEVKSGDNKGNRNHFIKSRLLQITWASINGEVVLAPPVSTTSDSSADNQQADDQVADQSAENLQSAEPSEQQPADEQIPATVELNLTDVDFVDKRADLEGAGYFLSGVNGVIQVYTLSQAA